MAYEQNDYSGPSFGNNDRNQESIFTRRIKAGKRRTYFFDVRATRGNDYFITLTESKKRFEDGSYERHKIYLYKEDFNKFLNALTETVNFVKTELMPDFDFDAFNHEYDEESALASKAHAANAIAILPEEIAAEQLSAPAQAADTEAERW